MKTYFVIIVILISGCGSEQSYQINTVQPSPSPIPAKPVLMVMGDSVSDGYHTFLQTKTPEYDVEFIGDNGRNSWYTLQHVDEWVAKFNPKVVVWNNGIWALCYNGYQNTGAPIEQFWESDYDYRDNIYLIAKKLLNKGIRVIFVGTEYLQPNTGSFFRTGNELVFNQIVHDTLPQLGVEIVDIYDATFNNLSWYQNDFEVHFTPIGYDNLAQLISNQIEGK